MLTADCSFGALITCRHLLDVGVYSVLDFSPAVKKKFKGFPIKTLTERFEDLPKGGSHTMYMIHELPFEERSRR